MASTTLSAILDKPASPYDVPLRAKVIIGANPVKYTNSNGEIKTSRDFIISDPTRIARVRSYDPTKDNLLKPGNSIIIKNYITKASGTFKFVVTSTTKIYKTANVDTIKNAESLAKNALNPPPAPEVLLKDVRKSPIKSLVSVKGQIVQVGTI